MLSSTVKREALSDEMRALDVVFPIGATLTVGGVYFEALVEHLSFGSTGRWGYSILSQSFFPVLVLGTVLAIVGSFIDRKRLPVTQSRPRGILCWTVSGISFLLLVTTGNVHGWTFAFIFPAFVGFIAGAVLLSKFTPQPSA
jgi:hypothetical protein